jgi:hypothetical protein
MKREPIRFSIDVLDDGRVRARSVDDAIVAIGDHIDELHEKVDQAVRALYGESRGIALLVSRARV